MKQIKYLSFIILFFANIIITSCSKDDNSDELSETTSGITNQFPGLWMECKQIDLYSEGGGQDQIVDYNAYTYTYICVAPIGENLVDGFLISYLDNQETTVETVNCQVNDNKIIMDGKQIGIIESCSQNGNWSDLIILWEKSVVFNNCGSNCRIRAYYMFRA